VSGAAYRHTRPSATTANPSFYLLDGRHFWPVLAGEPCRWRQHLLGCMGRNGAVLVGFICLFLLPGAALAALSGFACAGTDMCFLYASWTCGAWCRYALVDTFLAAGRAGDQADVLAASAFTVSPPVYLLPDSSLAAIPAAQGATTRQLRQAALSRIACLLLSPFVLSCVPSTGWFYPFCMFSSACCRAPYYTSSSNTSARTLPFSDARNACALREASGTCPPSSAVAFLSVVYASCCALDSTARACLLSVNAGFRRAWACKRTGQPTFLLGACRRWEQWRGAAAASPCRCAAACLRHLPFPALYGAYACGALRHSPSPASIPLLSRGMALPSHPLRWALRFGGTFYAASTGRYSAGTGGRVERARLLSMWVKGRLWRATAAPGNFPLERFHLTAACPVSTSTRFLLLPCPSFRAGTRRSPFLSWRHAGLAYWRFHAFSEITTSFLRAWLVARRSCLGTGFLFALSLAFLLTAPSSTLTLSSNMPLLADRLGMLPLTCTTSLLPALH